MPEAQTMDDETRKRLSPAKAIAVNTTQRGADGKWRRFVFVPEDSLASPPQQTARHELFHLLHRMLPEDARARIDAIAEQTKHNDGPYFKNYGAVGGELISTFGEMFDGAAGKAGVKWFRDNQPELFALLCEHTGRVPRT
jgi:hypothetical protein